MLTFKAKLTIKLVAIAFTALFVAVASLPLLGLSWHLFHGNMVSFEGRHVPVPAGFYVTQGDGGPAMWKASFGIPFFQVPYGLISLFHRPQGESFTFDEDYSQFKNALVQDAVDRGYKLSAERMVPAAETRAYCLEFSRSSTPPGSLVRCAIEGSRIAVFYEGDPRYTREMFAVLEGIR